MTRVRGFVMDRSFDVLLAVVGLAITQVRIIQQPGGWPNAPILLLVVIAIAPALIAVRRVDPVLAAIGLVTAAFCSQLVGQQDYVLLAGCALALWSLSSRFRPTAALALTVLTAALPLVARIKWTDFENAIYPSIYQHVDHPEGGSTTIGGIQSAEFDRILRSQWPWWASAALLSVGLLAIAYRYRRGPEIVSRTAGERIDDLRTFLLSNGALDAVLAMLAASLVLVDLCRSVSEGNWWSAPGWMPYGIAYSALTLVLRRHRPALPVVVLAVGALLTYWQMSGSWAVLGAVALALYSLAVSRRVRFSLPIATVVLVAAPVIAELIRYAQLVIIFPAVKPWLELDGFDGRYHNPVYEGLVDHQWPVLLSLTLALPVCGGVLMRLYRRNRVAAAREAELERRSEEQDAAQVVLTERSHIARDLHDVVAHAVNLMVIQAETGPDLLQRGDRDVLEGFQRIGDTGRRALGELDRLLSALRDADGVPDPQLAPQPGLAELRQLVRDVSHDRLMVELELVGDPGLPPVGHQLTAYRLVQEALTNVARHAEAMGAKVTVRVGADGIAVSVADDGRGFDLAVAGKGGRHGLAGMRERVRIHHGSLEVRTAPGSGTVVEAWIPVGGAASPAADPQRLTDVGTAAAEPVR
ncbi:ATP-binding protein [Kribbella sp. NPDC056861]|uniref:sensor histidine kinase n=1 Tax=Kribbella sp. NPDC056861 TaxID=3154857 RepID=UPI0034446A93